MDGNRIGKNEKMSEENVCGLNGKRKTKGSQMVLASKMKTKKAETGVEMVKHVSPKARELAAKLGIELDDKFRMHDIVCGLHSGIPPCCVAFFVMTWEPLMFEEWLAEEEKDTERLETIEHLMAGWWNCITEPDDNWGYIPCPACFLQGKRVKVRRCKCYDKRSKLSGKNK